MLLESPAFAPNEHIPAQYSCDGVNINPPLTIAEVPPEALSLALVMEDPDAPKGTFTHWVVWNLSTDITEIKEGELPPEAVQGSNDFGDAVYGGPCPPTGEHHYVFIIYALRENLSLAPGSDVNQLREAMQNLIIEEDELVGLYNRY